MDCFSLKNGGFILIDLGDGGAERRRCLAERLAAHRWHETPLDVLEAAWALVRRSVPQEGEPGSDVRSDDHDIREGAGAPVAQPQIPRWDYVERPGWCVGCQDRRPGIEYTDEGQRVWACDWCGNAWCVEGEVL